MNKKSQIAVESIMIYGLAILIVWLAVGALIYFEVIDLNNLLPPKYIQECSATNEAGESEWNVSSMQRCDYIFCKETNLPASKSGWNIICNLKEINYEQ